MRASLALGLVLLLFLFLAACGKQETVPLGSRISITPGGVDFGDVPVGFPPATRMLTLTNLSGDRLHLRGVQRGEDFEGDRYAFHVVDLPEAVEGNAAITFGVTAEAYAEMSQPVDSSFSVLTDYGAEAISVRARAHQVLVIDPLQIDFGRVSRGDAKTESVTITNNSDLEVTISRVGDIERIDGQGTFTLEGPMTNTLAHIPPRNGARIEITYRPSTARDALGADRARLTISSCPLPLCEISIELTGQGNDQALFCEHDAYDFGPVEIGRFGLVHVACTAGAASSITLDRAELRGASAGEMTVTPNAQLPAAIDANGTIDFAMVWRPGSTADLSASLRLTGRQGSTNRAITPVEVSFTGSRGSAEIVVSPASIDFGRVALGTSFRRPFLISNVGTRAAQIQAIDADGSGTGAFVSPDATPTTINPGESIGFNIEFLPTTPGRITSELVVTSNDPRGPEARVALSGEGVDIAPCQYQISPGDLDFGSVEPFREKNAPVSINNIGSDDCLLHGFELTAVVPTRFSLLSAPSGEVVLHSGESASMIVHYRPTDVARDEAELRFYISSPTASNPSLAVSGRGVSDAPIVYPDTIDFGKVAVGCGSETRRVRITNGRDTPMLLASAELVQGSNNELSLGLLNLPLNLPAHQSTEFSITYTPNGSGADSASLQIVEQSVAEPYVVWIAGAGDASNMVEERATQIADTNVDVLFVVDSYFSDADERMQIASNFSSFTDPADQLGIEYRIAIVDGTYQTNGFNAPCDRQLELPTGYFAGWCGYFEEVSGHPDSRIISRSTQPSPGAAFSALTGNVIGIGSMQQAFESARSALRAPLSQGWNSGLLREDAALAVVVVSDRSEQSPTWPEAYVDDLFSIHGIAKRNSTTLHAITGDAGSGCNGPNGLAQAGDTLIGAAQLSGGTFESICSADWPTAMGNLGFAVFGFRNSFALENHPATGTLEVVVDGITVPATRPSGEVAWVYDEIRNRVSFAPIATPEQGADIRFRYQTRCE